MPTVADTPPLGTSLSRPRRRRGWRLGALLVACGLVAVGLTLLVRQLGRAVQPTGCTATVARVSYPLGLSQAANAATIAVVAKRDGIEDHAVTVALAAALQESKLQNLPGGDLDSVGLFQQRPSEGWGPASDLMVPSYAAEAFYRALVQVPGWASLPVTDAAQAVQHSAAPEAYAVWEPEARDLAQVFTGEVPNGLACSFSVPDKVTATSSLPSVLSSEVGSPNVGSAVAPARGWTVASWLVAYAYAYRVTAVSFAGLQWTPSSGKWQASSPTQASVQLTRAGLAPGQLSMGRAGPARSPG